MGAWLGTERGRRLAVAFGLYVSLLAVYGAVAGVERLQQHTPYNHFAVQAEAWLEGRLDLGGPPPDYARNNDFAKYRGKWFVAFPAFPALLLVPLVAMAGQAERARDGQFFLYLAPLGPMLTFLLLEKLRALGRSVRTPAQNVLLALAFGLGSVYFFTAVQGTVWFAAHVVAVALAAAYALLALEARHPWLAGLALGLAFMSRAPLLFAAPFFLLEAFVLCRRPPQNGAAGEGHASRWSRALAGLRELDGERLVRLYLAFGIPLGLCLGLTLLHNHARFDDPFDVGYRHLEVAWRTRIARWGLFHYHYLAKNLGVVLTSMPWWKPMRINAHGLALWITTPAYLYLLWPGKVRRGFRTALVTAGCVAVPALLYQNTGWVQFGYRFSNDYAVFLFAALALTRRRFGTLFMLLLAWAFVVNAFGAISFDRPDFARYYYQQPSQNSLYQPD